MDVPPAARPVAAADADPRSTPPLSRPPGDDEVAPRLAALEAAVTDLARRVDALAASSEETVSAAVAREVHGVTAELRHTVSELGRLLVRDLGKLSKILAEHRDAIVAEVRGIGAQAPTGADEPPVSSDPDGTASEDAEAEPAPASAPAPVEGVEAVTPATRDDAERSWLRRRRQP